MFHFLFRAIVRQIEFHRDDNQPSVCVIDDFDPTVALLACEMNHHLGSSTIDALSFGQDSFDSCKKTREKVTIYGNPLIRV
jgi:hypothetical protein